MERLLQLDPELASLPSGDGEVMVSPHFQGRILASLQGELLHRFDRRLAAGPRLAGYDNLGGNSLWPAPEGGPLAFNYLPGEPGWLVQPGIAAARPAVAVAAGQITASQTIRLRNRRNIAVEMTRTRTVRPLPAAAFRGLDAVAATGYHSRDSFHLKEPQRIDDFVISAWSLEQFDLSGDAIGFALVGGDSRRAVNTDFYGDPTPQLTFGRGYFTFRLNAAERLQLGISQAAEPKLIGAWLPERKLLICRRTPVDPAGRYLNFADNDQPHGVFSASDVYSIFTGGPLGFFELEALAPVTLQAGRVTGSTLEATTWLLQGDFASLEAVLSTAARLAGHDGHP